MRPFVPGLIGGLLLSGLALAQQAAPRTPVPTPAAPQTPAVPVKPAAVLQGLDKVTARVSKLTIPVGEAANFGSLTIHVDACIKRPPEEPPENSAFLRIIDHPPQPAAQGKAMPLPTDPSARLPERLIFSGWMFASSPALHPLEHPVFDVIVLDCR